MIKLSKNKFAALLAAGLSAAVTLAALPTKAISETELRVMPHSGLKILDPIWTTAYISRNHGYMIYRKKLI